MIRSWPFTPSGFDWRIGVLDRRPLFACRYAIALGHWQIYKELPSDEKKAGRVQTFPVDEVPEAVVQTALKAANLIGDGLYGVDLKELDAGPLVIEINDNPSLESGDEDGYLKQELYLTIMRSFF
jgi:glutathione synthase/RimK-type ligase-like ATP-grasp enzyme